MNYEPTRSELTVPDCIAPAILHTEFFMIVSLQISPNKLNITYVYTYLFIADVATNWIVCY